MRGRLALGVVTVLALALAFSSLGLSQSPRSRVAQGGPPTDTPTSPPVTNTPTGTATQPNTPTSTATGVPPGPTATPGAPPTGAPGGGPPSDAAPATPSLGIRINSCARVVGPNGLSLADGPGLDANHVQIVGRDDIVFVTDGPQRADGLWWWKVTTREGVVGWGNNDHLLPFRGECFGVVGAAAPSVPTAPAPPGAVTTAGAKSELPSTGSGNDGLVFAGLLVLVLLVVGLVRRRSQGTI